MSDTGDSSVLRPRRRMLSDLTATGATVSAGQSQRVTNRAAVVTPAERRARATRRGAELLDAVSRIDTYTTPQAQAEIRSWLQEVYEARGGGMLLGLFSHCYLGAPYIDHVLDFGGEIVDHYTPSQTVPAIYMPARAYAISEAYRYIEIYADGQVIPIRHDGTSVV